MQKMDEYIYMFGPKTWNVDYETGQSVYLYFG